MPRTSSSRRVTDQELARLREQGSRDESLSAPQHEGTILALPDGRRLHDYGSFGNVWSSADELREFLNDEVRGQGPKPVLEGLFPSGVRFLERVDELCARLPALLGVEPSQLDGTMRSLQAIDEKVRELDMAERFNPDLFESIVAYAGEVIRGAVGGAGVGTRSPQGDVFEPKVRDAKGRLYSPAMVVFDELDEHDGEGGISIAGATEGEVLPLGVWPR
jgi:hypothetical protein